MDNDVDIVGTVFLFRPDGAALMQHRDDLAGLRHANMWVPPGGHCDPGETPRECAQREFLEETCYHCAEMHYLTVLHHPAEDRWRPFRLHVFWAVHDGRQQITCREGQALAFVSRRQAEELWMPSFILPLWDQALSAFLSKRDLNEVKVA